MDRAAAPRPQLVECAAVAQIDWASRLTLAGGGEVRLTRWGAVSVSAGATPSVGIFTLPQRAPDGAELEDLLRDARARGPHDIGVWRLGTELAPDVAAGLVGHGWGWGWQPHWMALDLTREPATDGNPPREISLRLFGGDEDPSGEELPYDETPPEVHARLAAAYPRTVWRYVAIEDGRIVGHCTLSVTGGSPAVAGVFDLGVVPSARRRGIGTALLQAVCSEGRARGCDHAVLNATPEGQGVYRRVGFESLGHGQTWWWHDCGGAAWPDVDEVRYAAAIGRGDLAAMDELPPRDPDRDLPGGLPPLRLAIECGRTDVAQWLVAHGAALDLISAWDLGWREDARRLAREQARTPAAEGTITPLHVAAARGDVELAALMLDAGATRDAVGPDGETPLDLARLFRHARAAELLTLESVDAGGNSDAAS
jgi:GNAT superfamily N-acetyltransferase